ncbi:(2Fe-2S)-binding protein [Halobacillus shinanisalinarum]|uniref:(2Fe-2S)-binding protein n=1 Tax=Halobacillus shinanisalinarum TaxID=2932258 RepID=A0ABY4H690_9BACI|nr:(2Fe-2S)-binding protein [Halobacillus shinanisalinarum]UOQ95639.1 (2Fe-2S)-binding protein [Halobacillus shinanisalinarum]
MMVCRCEEVTYKDLMETAAKYNCSARELKLRTRAGMGYCGGRTCRSMVDKMASNAESQKRTQITLKYQPPIRPIRFEDLGGKKNEPSHLRTPCTRKIKRK